MGKKSLGIDISDDRITGVALEQQGKSVLVAGCISLPLSEHIDVAAQIRQLCKQLDWREGACICGLSLSQLSVRNLALPFRGVKKIAQTLPFELEEQLIVPVDTQIADFLLSETTGSDTMLVVFTAEKTFLSGLLEGLQGVCDPEIITPSVVPLAAQIAKRNRDNENLLLLSADLHAITMVLIQGKRPLFYRRLSYPEQMILPPPFFGDSDQAMVTNMAAIEQSIQFFYGSIERSLDYFRMETKVDCRPERVVLTGPLAGVDGIADIIASVMHMPVEKLDLLSLSNIHCSDTVCPQWQGQRFDPAVSLALLGFGRKAGINFRKDAFVKKRTFFSSRKQLAVAAAAVAVLSGCVLGYMLNDYRLLRNRDTIIKDELTAIFKQTFPKVTKAQSPYIEMKAALKTVQGPGAPAPLFATDKRVLSLLADISARIPETIALQVNRLSIEREAVFLKGTTDTFNKVEIIKNALAASPRYRTAQIVTATADKEKKNNSIRFEIQLQFGGGI